MISDGGGVGIVELHYSSSLVALVGSGDEPTLSPRKLKLFNTKNNGTLYELNFLTAILAIRWNRQRLVVVLETKIHIYDLEKMEPLQVIETDPNPTGVCGLSSDQAYLAYPRSGKLCIYNAQQIRPIATIDAHKGPVSIVAFSNDGQFFATASQKGTVIRVFSISTRTTDGQKEVTKLYTFRRGTYPATINSLTFSGNNRFLAVASSSGTIHIFKLEAQAPSLTSGLVSYYLPSINEMWEPGRAFAWFRLPTQTAAANATSGGNLRSICVFRDVDKCVSVVSEDGILYHFLLDTVNGGVCTPARQVFLREYLSSDNA
jgi:autophagy-related protein 18